MTCPNCKGGCFVAAVTEREILHPAATDWDGRPLALCPTCDGVGEIDRQP